MWKESNLIAMTIEMANLRWQWRYGMYLEIIWIKAYYDKMNM
jgi:hypothetical protein